MLFNAHIFKRRSRGDREEVRIKLFNLDGTDAELGGGGGGASQSLRVRSDAAGLIELEASLPTDIPFGNTFLFHKEGFEFEAGDLEIPAAPGIYLFQMEDSWGSLDGSAASGQARSNILLAYPDPEDPETTYFDDLLTTHFRAPYSAGGAYKVGVAIVKEVNATFRWQVDQNSQELGMTYQGVLTIVKL